LESTTSLIDKAGRRELLKQRRAESCLINVRGKSIRLQSQWPLHAENINFQGGWDLESLIECLNGLVFFWPGTKDGPVSSGRNHFESQSWAKWEPVAIRVATRELFDANPDSAPLFSPYNSGSPRFSGGKPSPRGPETFLPADQFSRNPSKVVELTFPRDVRLPRSSQRSSSPNGPWDLLFQSESMIS